MPGTSHRTRYRQALLVGAVAACALLPSAGSAATTCTTQTKTWTNVVVGARHKFTVTWCWNGSTVVSHSLNSIPLPDPGTQYTGETVYSGQGGNGSAYWIANRGPRYKLVIGPVHLEWNPVLTVRVNGNGTVQWSSS